MSTVSGQDSPNAVHEPPGDLRLTNWPLVDDARRAWPTIVGAFALSVFAGYWSQNLAMALLCFAALNTALWRIWIPVSFELGPKGVWQTMLGRQTRVPWSMIARYEITGRGVLLLPDDPRTPLVSLRGIHIRWRDHRDQLLELVRYYVIPRSRS
jgi:hypothetical protein